MSIPPVPKRYADLFKETIHELQEYLALTMRLFSEEWKGVYGILPLGDDQAEMVVPGGEAQRRTYAPFCHYVRSVMNRSDLCMACDRRAANRVANSEEPTHYWCDWGMVDMAIPIMLHGFCLGVIFCGQKTLKDSSDSEGLEGMESFAKKLGYDEEQIKALRENRARREHAVTLTEIEDMLESIWGTSRAISRKLYARLNPKGARLRKENRAKAFRLPGELSAMAWKSDCAKFWDDFKSILDGLCDLFDARGIVVCGTNKANKGEAEVLQSHWNSSDTPAMPVLSEEDLISRDVQSDSGPAHKAVRWNSHMPACALSSHVINKFGEIDMILYHRLVYGEPKNHQALHFLVYLESALDHRHNLRFQQKELMLDQVARVTADIYWLQRDRDKTNNFLLDVTHQINQPIHGLVTYCDNLISAKIKKKLNLPMYIREMAVHCSYLVRCAEMDARGLKQFAASQRFKPVQESLTSMLIDTAINVQGYAELEDVKVHVNESVTDLLGNVEVDEDFFEMAVTNVVYNAVKYSHPGTRTDVYAEHDTNSHQLVIRVKNIGIEIPQDMWDKVFERRFRTPEAKKKSFAGLGIGLSATRAIFRAMGGEAAVEQSKLVRRSPDGTTDHYETVLALTLPEKVIKGAVRRTP